MSKRDYMSLWDRNELLKNSENSFCWNHNLVNIVFEYVGEMYEPIACSGDNYSILDFCTKIMSCRNDMDQEVTEFYREYITEFKTNDNLNNCVVDIYRNVLNFKAFLGDMLNFISTAPETCNYGYSFNIDIKRSVIKFGDIRIKNRMNHRMFLPCKKIELFQSKDLMAIENFKQLVRKKVYDQKVFDQYCDYRTNKTSERLNMIKSMLKEVL